MLLCSEGERLCIRWPARAKLDLMESRHKRPRIRGEREKLVTVEEDLLAGGHSSGGHMGLSDS